MRRLRPRFRFEKSPSHRGVELVPIPRNAAPVGQNGGVEDQYHEGLVGDSVPLTLQAERRGKFEAEARVVLRMPQHNDERTGSFLQHLETVAHEQRANASSLAIGRYRHRRQAHALDHAIGIFDHDRGEQDVTHHPPTLFGNH